MQDNYVTAEHVAQLRGLGKPDAPTRRAFRIGYFHEADEAVSGEPAAMPDGFTAEESAAWESGRRAWRADHPQHTRKAG